MAQEANSRDPGSIPGGNASFDVPGTSCDLSSPGLQLVSRYTGRRGGSSGMPSAGVEDNVTGTLKQVKSSVARAGWIVLPWSGNYGAEGLFLRPGLDSRSEHNFWRPWTFLSPFWPRTPTGYPLQTVLLLVQHSMMTRRWGPCYHCWMGWPISQSVHGNLHILLIVLNALWNLVFVARLSLIAETGCGTGWFSAHGHVLLTASAELLIVV